MICRWCRREIRAWPSASDPWPTWMLAFEHPTDANRTYCEMGPQLYAMRLHAPLTRDQVIRELVEVYYS